MSLENKPLRGTAPGERHKRFFVNISEQWSGFVGAKSWRDFCFIKLEFEIAHYTGRVELSLGLLGICVDAVYIYDNAFLNEILTRQEEILREIAGVTGIDPKNIHGLEEALGKADARSDDGE